MDAMLKNFAVPGRIAFRSGNLSEIVVLVSPGGSAEISLYGGQVLSWRPTGQPPVLFLSDSFAMTGKGKAIRGGIPVSWPWFGKAPSPQLPNHGFARTSLWRLAETEYDKDETSALFVLEDDANTRKLWNRKFALELKVTVGRTLKLELKTKNTGEEKFSVTEAFHSYFRVRDIEKAVLYGFDGQPYADAASSMGAMVQSGAIALCCETDRIYTHHEGTANLEDGGIGRRTIVKKSGSDASVVWNPWSSKAASMADLEEGEWRRFVCVETANLGRRPIEISPGGSHVMKAEIESLLLDGEGKIFNPKRAE